MVGIKRKRGRGSAAPSRGTVLLPPQSKSKPARRENLEREYVFEEDNYDDEGTENETSDSENYEKMDESESDDADADAAAEKDVEMQELENEYKKLKDEEQNIFRNLKQHTEEDIQKGQAVKNQRALWDKALEFRFLLQKPFLNSNRLPLEPVRSLFYGLENEVSEAYSDLITSSEKTLDAILELQQALLANNPQIMSSGEDTKRVAEASCSSNDDTDEKWSEVLEIQTRMASFRNASIDKWQRKTLVATGAAAIKDKLHAFNQSTSQQVASYMRDPSKMVKGMQQNRSSVAVFGNVPTSNENVNPEKECYPNGDPELLDDSEFYQQLLKEFIESIDPSSSETAYYALKRFQTKKRKVVDRRASKSRKIRYHVHEKLVNFMAPRRMDLPPLAPQLFASLFGGKG